MAGRGSFAVAGTRNQQPQVIRSVRIDHTRGTTADEPRSHFYSCSRCPCAALGCCRGSHMRVETPRESVDLQAGCVLLVPRPGAATLDQHGRQPRWLTEHDVVAGVDHKQRVRTAECLHTCLLLTRRHGSIAQCHDPRDGHVMRHAAMVGLINDDLGRLGTFAAATPFAVLTSFRCRTRTMPQVPVCGTACRAWQPTSPVARMGRVANRRCRTVLRHKRPDVDHFTDESGAQLFGGSRQGQTRHRMTDQDDVVESGATHCIDNGVDEIGDGDIGQRCRVGAATG